MTKIIGNKQLANYSANSPRTSEYKGMQIKPLQLNTPWRERLCGSGAKICAIWSAFTVVVAVALLATIGTAGIGLLGAGICVAAGALALKYMESCERSRRAERMCE